MSLNRYHIKRMLLSGQQLRLLLIMLAFCAMPGLVNAQIELNQNTTSNGAGLLSGGNYTGYASAGQIATYMYANSVYTTTQGIILNEIGSDVEFTFELSGNLTENEENNQSALVLKSAKADLLGEPLAGEWVYLILASDSTVFDSTQTDNTGAFVFSNVPYLDFFFMVGSSEVTPQTPTVLLAFEENPVFVKEVEINGEIGAGGEIGSAQVVVTPQLTTNTENEQDLVYWYRDADGDGFGDANNAVKLNANSQQVGYVDNDADCDDTRDYVYPGSQIDTVGTGLDYDCNGEYRWYEDIDLDEFGSEAIIVSTSATPNAGEATNNNDCDDTDEAINPNATDAAGSGIDSNCDGYYLWFVDNDGDGYGSTETVSSLSKVPGQGESDISGDCNDANAGVNVGTADVPGSGVDSDCDGYFAWFADLDGDGYGTNEIVSSVNTIPGIGESDNKLDCNDEDASIHPDATDEVASGADLNCDGMYLWYEDQDNDGYGTAVIIESENESPGEFESDNDMDCDDTRDDIYPGAPELPGSGVDSNCDGILGCEGINIVELYSPQNSIQIGESFEIFGMFEGDQPENITWDWGDGSQSEGSVVNGEVNGYHNYLQSGLYEITLYVENSCGDEATLSFKHAVVVDPCAGKISALGYYLDKKNSMAFLFRSISFSMFKLHAEYNSSDLPATLNGSFSFYSSSARVWFASQSLNWMVINENVSYVQGTGIMNNQQNYSFIICVVDSKEEGRYVPDLVRVMLFDSNNEMVFDSQEGASLTALPIQKISPFAVSIQPSCNELGKSAGINDNYTSLNVVDETESELFDVQAFPNPTKGRLTLNIQNPKNEEVEITVHNLAGQKILQKSNQNSKRIELDLTGNSAGVYFVNVVSGDDRTLCKIVLQRE